MEIYKIIFKNSIFKDESTYYLTALEIQNGELTKILNSGMIENG